MFEKLRLKARMLSHADGWRKLQALWIGPGNVDHLTASHTAELDRAQWDLIKNHLPEEFEHAVDLGSARGGFSFRLAESTADGRVVGYEMDKNLSRFSADVADYMEITNVRFSNNRVLIDNLDGFPDTDVLLLLSVFHEWQNRFGTERATELLQEIWSRVGDCMFFSCADASSSHRKDYVKALAPWGLTQEEVRATLESILNELEHAEVSYLGSAYFVDRSTKMGKENRMIFKVSRQKPELSERVAAIDWYHTIDLGSGIVTPGIFDHRKTLDLYRLPDRMDGLRVLDVATWDGFWAFEFERRGAEEVVALDIPTRADVDLTPEVRRQLTEIHGHEAFHARTGPGFEVAHEQLGSSVSRHTLNVYDLSPEAFGTFDVVHIGDLLLHLKYPLRALENILSVTSEYAIISEAYVAKLDEQEGDHVLRYLSGEKDVIWWEFSLEVLQKMILDAGFERVELINTFKFGGPFDHAVFWAYPPK